MVKITYTNPKTGLDEVITDVRRVNLYFEANTACVHFNDKSKGMVDLAISQIKHIDEVI